MHDKKDDAYKKMLADIFPDQYRDVTDKKVYIINGAPGSGKTTYMQIHKNDQDLVVDLDYICAALNGTHNLYQDHESVLNVALQVQEQIYQAIENRAGKWENAYVITAASDKEAVDNLVKRLDGELISIDTPLSRCVHNIQNDARRSGCTHKFVELAKAWFEAKESAF